MKIIKITLLSLLVAITSMATVTAMEESEIATLRNSTALHDQENTNKIPKVINSDVKQSRSYPMQPPIIPHQTRNYQVDTRVNKCMSCHSRQQTTESQAPMVSVTHYMDREGNFLAEVSPRRYFCNQCHVTQLDAKPLVENTFEDMHSLMNDKKSNEE